MVRPSMALFGDTFSHLASAPLNTSGRALNNARMGEGIRLLERTHLENAIQQGLQAVAQVAGVHEDQVRALLPHEELQGALDRLQKRQEKAIQAVRRQEMTVATFAMPNELPTAPSASEQLTSLSTVFARDKEMAARLRDLSFEVAAWEALLKRCASTLDNNPQLLQSFRRKRLLRLLTTWGLLGAVVTLAAAAALWVFLRQRERKAEEERQAQERAQLAELQRKLQTTLALPDPCAPDGLTSETLARLNDEQKRQLEARAKRCEEVKQKLLREQRCADLVAHVNGGQFTTEDAALAGASKATLRRLSSKAITPADLNLPPDAMPCAGTEAESKLWELLARVASGGGPNLWALAEGVSPKLVAPLAAPGVLHPSTILAIAFRSEKLATLALKTGREVDARRAHGMCELKAKLGQALALSCKKILK
ncbi:MAG: hypothetical protein RMJ98_06075 [Myxococcales bacterium]|nr:hypothetical protein [Polyangiaceae bacterium]MDW8248856.1 hypothetical protein [Myxococcales bacterium]